ncbi:MAG TPA: DUF3488 and transglutaminase-like domain-containing protein, partial [Longimicrobiales bacterium]|nr:DUF3488 and transglutaminase-like domain-containing protein [Longimicrobiales bacterium]
LLALLASEALRPAATTEHSRMYSLSFALLLAAAAYRAGVAFGFSFVVYIAAGTVALLLGHLVRESRRRGLQPPALRAGFLLRIAALSSVMLFMSGLLFIAFPRVTRSWVSRGAAPGSSVAGFGDRMSLAEHGGRIYPNPEVVLRAEFPLGRPQNGRPLYWRGRSYDYFDGVNWWRSPGVFGGIATSRWYQQRWPRNTVRAKVYARPLDVPVLFVLHPTLALEPQSRMRVMPDPSGDLGYAAASPPVYEVVAPLSAPEDAELARANGGDANRAFLQTPALSPAIRRLADSLAAGAETRLARTRAVETYLCTQLRYTLELPASAREAELEYFLFRRRAGHCEYFSTAMVMLVRSLGIPARNVNGFLGGEWTQFGGFLSVTQNQAHSWVEVWFPEYGWVPFDPTPAASGQAAGARRGWLGPLRTAFDGLEHRWNKWVLEYNLETQVGVFRRMGQAISPTPRADARGPRDWQRLVPLAAAVGMVLLALGFFFRSRHERAAAPSAETRAYVRLRRAYQKRGLAVESDGPLTFLRRLQQARTPGHEHAAVIVELYLESRFGRREIGPVGRARMQQALATARRELARARSAA